MAYVWEQRKLGELAEIVGGGTPSTSVESYWDGDIDWYAPAEIGEQIYLKSSQRKITEEGLNKSSAKVLPVGTVLFTSRAGIGKTAILLKEGCTNQGFQSIVPNKDKLDSYFIFTRSEELKRYGETVGAGSTFVEVSGKQMANMELMMPTIMDEQQKIGEYFSYLDHLITLHQRKFDQLKTAKTYFLQNMFPAKGKKVPRIRFHGFTGDWEQRKLGELCNLLTGYPFESKSFSTDGIKLIRGMNVKRGYLDFSGDICKWWKSSNGLENYLLQDNDILIQMDGALIGQSYAKINKNQLPALLVQRVTRARTYSEISNSNFIYSAIQKDFLPYIKENKTETAVPHLSLSDISNFIIKVPTLVEQKKIGNYFSNFDNLITLHQRKLDQLKTLKKFMLQNLFI